MGNYVFLDLFGLSHLESHDAELLFVLMLTYPAHQYLIPIKFCSIALLILSRHKKQLFAFGKQRQILILEKFLDILGLGFEDHLLHLCDLLSLIVAQLFIPGLLEPFWEKDLVEGFVFGGVEVCEKVLFVLWKYESCEITLFFGPALGFLVPQLSIFEVLVSFEFGVHADEVGWVFADL